MTTHNLKVDKREITGKKVKNLRRDGLLPGNIFGKKIKSQAVQVASKEFAKVYEEVGETSIIDLTLDSVNIPVLVSGLQLNPVTGDFLHIDFRQVNLKEKITATVPIELVGVAPAEKNGLGILVQQLNEVEVEALPTDFPENIEVDVSNLVEVDQSISVGDLKYDKAKLTLAANEEQLVAIITPLQKEEVPVEVPVAEEAEAKPVEETGPEGEIKAES